MGKKRGLFSFIFGASLGGLVTMLTSKRSGTAIRKDLMREWEAGKPGLDVLGKEVKDIAMESKKAIMEFYNSDKVQAALSEASEKGKVALQEQYDKAMDMLGDVKQVTAKQVKKAQEGFEKKLEEAFDHEKKK